MATRHGRADAPGDAGDEGPGVIASAVAAGGGWALAPILDWLMVDGRRIEEPTDLADALCGRLLAAGAPLWRMRFSFHTLHPQVAACAFTWVRGGHATEFCLPHGSGWGGGDLTADAGTDPAGTVDLTVAQLDPELDELVVAGGIDHLIEPLDFGMGRAGALIAATDRETGFSTADGTKFALLATFLTPVLEVIAVRRIARTLLDTYVGHRAGQKILEGQIKRGDAETIRAALWFSDLRDFTRLTETLPAAELLTMLNAYFEHVTVAVTRRGGEVLRFIGDAMLVIFPEERAGDAEQTCRAALEAAIETFDHVDALNRERRRTGAPPIRFGVGLHTGRVVYGNVGAPDRLDFTVLGPAVNRAARLESLTKETGVPLLMSGDFAARVDRPVESLGRFEMKGIAEPQEAIALSGRHAAAKVP